MKTCLRWKAGWCRQAPCDRKCRHKQTIKYATPAGSSRSAVLILPGFLSAAAEYGGMAKELEQLGHQTGVHMLGSACGFYLHMPCCCSMKQYCIKMLPRYLCPGEVSVMLHNVHVAHAEVLPVSLRTWLPVVAGGSCLQYVLLLRTAVAQLYERTSRPVSLVSAC